MSSKNDVIRTQNDAAVARDVMHNLIGNIEDANELAWFDETVIPLVQSATDNAERALHDARVIYGDKFDDEIEPLIKKDR